MFEFSMPDRPKPVFILIFPYKDTENRGQKQTPWLYRDKVHIEQKKRSGAKPFYVRPLFYPPGITAFTGSALLRL